MLDEQFFDDEKYHKFLDKNFVSIFAYRKHPSHGVDVFGKFVEKYKVQSTPTALFALPDWTEIDRIVGFRNADKYQKDIEKILKNMEKTKGS